MTGSGKNISLGKTNAAILNGTEDLSLWSDEELLRGQRKGKNGRWTGRKPTVVPLALHHELNSRRMVAAREELNSSLVAAVSLFGEVVNDEDAPLELRLRAAKEITDRVLGRAPEHVSVHLEPEPWERLLVDSLVYIDGDEPIETTGVRDG
jgi:hypothetical protein